MADILDLKEFEILQEFKNDEHRYRKFVVQAKEEPFLCTECGYFKGEGDEPFKKHDTRTRLVKDIEIRGYKVVLEVKQRRFKCPCCGSRAPEYFDSIERDDKITKRLFEYVGKQALQDNFLKIASWHGISESTVKRAFLKEVAELDKKRVLVAPECLGIDEIYLTETDSPRKQPYAIFTDIQNKRVLEIVKGNTKEIVIQVLTQMKGIEDVKVVSMDMNSGYRHAVFECCPNSYTVVDRFHVMQKFGMLLDTIRATIQSKLGEGEKKELFNVRRLITSNREDLQEEALLKLDIELAKYPNLKKAYDAKEDLRIVYKSKTKREAFEKYYAWEQTLTKDMKEVKGLQRMINRLKKEIFAYFDERYTNAYTECANSLIRRIIHDGNGYGFEVLRGKILYGTPASKQKRVKVKDMNFYEIKLRVRNPKPDEECKFIQYGEIEVVAYYTDIDELIAYIDEGKF